MENKQLEERFEQIVESREPFVDGRGRIDNFDLKFPVSMANIITSKKGTVRANHYHPEQLQQVLVVSGSYLSVAKDLSIQDSELRFLVVKTGQLSIMPPMVAHTMIFLEDCTFINLVPNEREHQNFGKHTVPYVLVKPEEIKNYIEKYKGK